MTERAEPESERREHLSEAHKALHAALGLIESAESRMKTTSRGKSPDRNNKERGMEFIWSTQLETGKEVIINTSAIAAIVLFPAADNGCTVRTVDGREYDVLARMAGQVVEERE